ncbi:hypothetical protein ACET3Z_031386 [Daucus carota]
MIFRFHSVVLISPRNKFEMEKKVESLNCERDTLKRMLLMTKEVSRLVNALKEAKDEVFATKEEEARLKNTLEEAESEMHYLKEVTGEAKAESMKLQESLTDKENELRSVIQENNELQNTESASLLKVKELSKLNSSWLSI